MSEFGDGIIQGLEEVVEFLDGKRALKRTSWVEVVKCKDCIYQAECAFTEWLGRNGNGFCSCGERKEDEID